MWLYYNLFQPVLRQFERNAVRRPNGTVRIQRRQDQARTPLRRLLEAHPPVSRKTREHLLTLHQTTNPMALKRCIHSQSEALKMLSYESSKEEGSAPV